MLAINDMETGRSRRSAKCNDSHAIPSCLFNFLHISSCQSAFLQNQHSFPDSLDRSIAIKYQMLIGYSLGISFGETRRAVEDMIENLATFCFQGFQITDTLHSRRCDNRGIGFDFINGFPVGITPYYIIVSRGKDSLETNCRNIKICRHVRHRIVKTRGKGMGGIHQQPYVILATEVNHLIPRHGSTDCIAMTQFHLLLSRFGRVVERFASLFYLLDCLPSLSGASEHKNHSSPFLNK